MVEWSTLDKFEKFCLSVEIFMGFMLVIYKFVYVCATVTVEIHTAGT
jgi:hypothetical protein